MAFPGEKNVHSPLLPEDCVHFDVLRGHTIAMSDVFRSAGHRANELYGYYSSGNTSDAEKKRAAKRFMALTGFHPDKIHEIIDKTNSWFPSEDSK